MTDSNAGAYIREAKLPEELPVLSRTAARAFASHPMPNYFSNQTTSIHLQENGKNAKSMRQLTHFEESTLRTAMLIGGRIMVVVVPEGNGKERIAACAAWIPPNSPSMDGLAVLVRAKSHRVVFDWGLTSLKRVTVEYLPTIQKRRIKMLRKRGVKGSDYWYLELLFTNPEDEGHGYCGQLLREMEAFDSTRILTLDASTERSIGVYKHYGWEIYDEFRLGVGKAGEDGTKATGEKSKGVLNVMMSRTPSKA
ncbi:hypothetical protein BD626DRAFT_493929 [Schizophyllum amplum]|uniref:N-acetyltransferase domain-containing protein n=1 Tax=Schizophyllum amplum TaxID=97359 RepID=A0A550CH68_9AGAR|nr:hypothetical protein BD626DRAFT_493929 [Auriculariopsis ampla]